MNCQQVRECLDDFVDGCLSPEGHAHIEEHVSSCTACRRELDALRSLLQQTTELRPGIEPGRELWAEIEARLRRRTDASRVRKRRWLVYPLVTGLAAAAVLLIAVSPYFFRSVSKTESALGTQETAKDGDLSEEVRKADEEYARAREELMNVLKLREGDLAPETRRVFEENLLVIDGAVAEIRAALEQDPENARLVHMLAATHNRGLKLMALAAELSTES